MYYYKCKHKKLLEWCSICGNTYKIETKDDDDYFSNLATHICCNKCMIDLDIEIADEVIALNNLGYLTEFSCSGHSLGAYGYILFPNLMNKEYSDLKNACKDLVYVKSEKESAKAYSLRFGSRMDIIEYKPTSTGNIYTKRNYDLYIVQLKKELQLLISRLPDISDKYKLIQCNNGYAVGVDK